MGHSADLLDSQYLLVASMDVDPLNEELFNSVYDQEHIPFLSEVPGVRKIVRYRRQPFQMRIGGELRSIDSGQPQYHAIYAIDGPEVLESLSWGDAVERGRWPSQVRPKTRNRAHLLLRNLADSPLSAR